MKGKKRFIVFSDLHFFRGTDLKEKQGLLTLKERIALKILNFIWPDKESLCQEYFWKMLDKASELEPFDYLLDLGDAIFGSNNQGLITEQDCQKRKIYNQMIDDGFPGVSKKFLSGNHDVGSQYWLSKIFNPDYQKEGLSKESFLKAKELIGPPWDTFEVEDFTFLLLNSEIIRASNRKNSHDRHFFIEKAEQQEEFIEDTLKDASSQVILAIHNPLPLKYVWSLLKPYHQRIRLTLAGHFHYHFPGELLWKLSPMYRSLNLKVISPPWPWKGNIHRRTPRKGGSFTTLELSGCSLKPNHHRL